MSAHMFQFRELLAEVDTSSTDWTVLMADAPVIVPAGPAKDLLLDFRMTVEVEETNPEGTTFLGGALRFVWDGVPLAAESFIELDLASTSQVETFSGAMTMRALVAGVSAGTHQLRVEWQTISADSLLRAFPHNATLTIEEKP